MQAPRLTCSLRVNTTRRGWHKRLTKIFQDIQGLAFSIDVPNGLMYLDCEVDPLIFIKKLYKARTHALLYRIDYGYEENPQGTRKPNSHFMRGRFELDTFETIWYKRIILALKTIQGVSFTIDTPMQMGYIRGNIETGVLMKMLVRTGIQMLTMDYGFENKNPELNPPPPPPPKKPEAPANETKPQSAKDTDPPPHGVTVSTKHQVTYKKLHAIRSFFGF